MRLLICKASEDPHQLRQQIKAVQAQLEQLQLKNKVLETIISVAEKEFKHLCANSCASLIPDAPCDSSSA